MSRILYCLLIVTCMACSGPQTPDGNTSGSGIGLDSWEGLLYQKGEDTYLWDVETGSSIRVGTTVVEDMRDLLEQQAVTVRGMEIEDGKIAANSIEPREPFVVKREGFVSPQRLYGGPDGALSLSLEGSPVDATTLEDYVAHDVYVRATFHQRLVGAPPALASVLHSLEGIATPEGLMRINGLLVEKSSTGGHVLLAFSDGQAHPVTLAQGIATPEEESVVLVGTRNDAGGIDVLDVEGYAMETRTLEGILARAGEGWTVAGTPVRFKNMAEVLLEARLGKKVRVEVEPRPNTSAEPYTLDWTAYELTTP